MKIVIEIDDTAAAAICQNHGYDAEAPVQDSMLVLVDFILQEEATNAVRNLMKRQADLQIEADLPAAIAGKFSASIAESEAEP